MMKVFSSPSASSSLFYYNLNLMSKVKTITISGKVSEYDVKYTKAYVAKIISAQSDSLKSHLNDYLYIPNNAVKEIYVDGVLEAELIGSNLLYVQKRPKHDPYVDRQEPTQEEFDESHALDMVLNDMVESMTDEELEQMFNNEQPPEPFATDVELANIKGESKDIYLQSVTAPPPYWVTDTTAGNIDISYTN